MGRSLSHGDVSTMNVFEIQITNGNLGYISQRNYGTHPLINKTTLFSFYLTLHACARENKHSAFHFKHLFLSLIDICLNIQSFVYSEFGKYRQGLRRNKHILMKCNSCVSTIQ